MANLKADNKITLERNYIIPIKRRLRHVPDYKKARKAVKIVAEFIAKHMKVEERDTKKVKIDKLLNHELWHRGIANPPNKIKVKTKKHSNGIVTVELFEIPKVLQYRIDRENRKNEVVAKAKTDEKPSSEQKTEPSKDDKELEEKKVEAKEKQAAVVEAGFAKQTQEAKQQKHVTSEKPVKRQTPVQRNIPKGQ